MQEVSSENIIRKKLENAQHSPVRTYIDLTVGNVRFSRFLLYEFLTCLLGPLPGGLGFFLRKRFYPMLFKKVGKGMIIGRNVVIRHPDKIELGDYVTIDDNSLIDARGAGSFGVVIGNNVIINRNCMVQAKAGPIKLGKRTSIGSNSAIVSMSGVEVGEAVLTGGGCYISSGTYHTGHPEKAIMDQGVYSKGPIRIGAKALIGTGVTVLDGVTIGEGAVIGAGAVVTKDIPGYSIATGIPAKARLKNLETDAP
jgi:acetyltransferase-like isoleucine patch superfamily enzyme